MEEETEGSERDERVICDDNRGRDEELCQKIKSLEKLGFI